MHYGMDYEILHTVDITFVLAAFVPFHSVLCIMVLRFATECCLHNFELEV